MHDNDVMDAAEHFELTLGPPGEEVDLRVTALEDGAAVSVVGALGASHADELRRWISRLVLLGWTHLVVDLESADVVDATPVQAIQRARDALASTVPVVDVSVLTGSA